MGNIIGIGECSHFYLYIFLTTITQLIKDDIFLGNGGKLAFNLVITKHKFMTLLLGYLSEVFFGLLMFIFFEYKEYKRKKLKNSILFKSGIEYEKKTSLDKFIEKITRPKKKNKSKNKKNKNLLPKEDKNLNSDKNETNSSINLRNPSLIHTDIYQDIIGSSFWLLILSSCLIVNKEILNIVIYSTYDIFDYFFLNLVILTYILKIWNKQTIYNHQRLAVIIVTVSSGLCLIICLIINNNIEEKEMKNIIDKFQNDNLTLISLIFVYILISISYCSGIFMQKQIIENKFVTPYKIILFKGIIGLIGTIIGLIITSNLECVKTDEDNDSLKFYKIFDYFICSVTDEKGEHHYFDHFSLYFTSVKERVKEALILILYCIFHFFANFSLILINQFLSPVHYLITESLYSLINIPLVYLSEASYENIKESINNGDKSIDLSNIYNAVIQTFGNNIIKFISCFFNLIGYIIYLEIIELKFCGLNKDLKKNIIQRASVDWASNQEVDKSSCNSDDDENDDEEESVENSEEKEKSF